jgi:hypothetical protein
VRIADVRLMDDDQRERLSAAAAQLRANGTIGRSELINRLFDFLLEQSLAGRSPKEVEVAQEVFGRDARFDMNQDASVRVHIHRLRRKLEEASAGMTGDWLTIPRGEYRLAVQGPNVETEGEPLPDADDPVPAVPRRLHPTRRSMWTFAGLALAVAIGAAFSPLVWKPGVRSGDLSPLAESAFWKPLATSQRLSFLVTGDYYIFGEAPNTVQVTRLVREFSINSREDLDEYLMTHPDDYGRYVDMDLHYLPVSTGYALREVLPVMNNLVRNAGMGRPYAITMSRLASEAIKGSNIIYVGYLSGLGVLRDPLLEASGLSIGSSYDELVDRASGRHYISGEEKVTGNRSPRRDFAYIASFPGPSGNRILIIAGTRDAAVMQAAEVATDKAQLDRIAARAGNDVNFEALFEVRTLGTLNLGSTLVLSRPLKLDRLWRPGAMPGKAPDQPLMSQPARVGSPKR